MTFSGYYTFFINDIALPNTFRSIEAGINDKLYIQFVYGNTTPYPTTRYNIITLPSYTYTDFTLATLIAKSLNDAEKENLGIGFNTWTFKCSYDQIINSFNISATLESRYIGNHSNNTWHILTDYEMKNIAPQNFLKIT